MTRVIEAGYLSARHLGRTIAINTRTGEVVPFASPSEVTSYVSITTPPGIKSAAVEQIGPQLQAVLDAGVLGIEA